MIFDPRYYQQDAHDAVIEHARKSLEHQLCVEPTGSGKSVIIANVAASMNKLTDDKKIMVLAPSKKLVTQNHAKYASYGYQASIFCASANKKSLRHDVVFGSPLTVLNSIDRVCKELWGCVIIDEADLITLTIKAIIERLKQDNPSLRVIGLTATPYRMGTGYIYESHYQLGFCEETIEPYFKKVTHEVSAKELIDHDPPWLTKPILGKAALRYETDTLVMSKSGKWTDSSLDQAFVGKERLTAEIVADIIQTTKNYNGVMIYAATIQHGDEIMLSLPPELSGFVHSKNKESDAIIERFEKQEIKYIVNVGVLTVGVDFPHADVICMLRLTESARLYQQIIGRILRLYPGKTHGLILDYANNNANHFPDGNVFNPKITARKPGESERIPAICPECNHENQFAMRPDMDNYVSNENGYATWPDTKDLVTNAEGEPIPMHLGRRCTGIVRRVDRCGYYWTSKKCPECEHFNDIASRYCQKCKHELVNPNDKLLLEGAKQGSIMVEPVMTITLEDKVAKNGTTKLKHVLITTALRKRINLFLRMSIEAEREQFRLCRAMADQECSVEFKPDGKYWKFVNLTTDNGYMK